jgi:hypothetical protein
MQIEGIRESEATPAALFEDFHRRMGLRNKISNAQMAIALFEAKSNSQNFSKYVADGLSISKQCVLILGEIAQAYHPEQQYRDYTAKVILDILTNRLMQDPDKTKLERYKKGFSSAEKVFSLIEQKAEPDQQMVKEAEQIIEEIDREIESTYASEECLYRGSFAPR